MKPRSGLPATLLATAAIALAIDLAALAEPARAETTPEAELPVNHIVVIYQENHSFDNLFGSFPGANGLAETSDSAPQSDRNGKPYPRLPKIIDNSRRNWPPDPRFSASLSNGPFQIDQYVPADERIPDLMHRFYQNQLQIDGGRNDRFAAWSDAGGLPMGYYDTARLPL